MRKAIVVGVLAASAAIALRPVVRRMGQRMREHCEQMAAQLGGRGKMRHTMRECCEQMAAQLGGRGEAVRRT